MTRAALFTKHEGIAIRVASEYRIPGLGPDDVRQEARVALWEATGDHDPTRGAFPSFARLVITRRLIDLLRAATLRVLPLDDVEPEDRTARERLEHRARLARIVELLPQLSETERQAVCDHLNGAKTSKAHDSALYRARRKLREADTLASEAEAC